jgi:trypsin
LIQFLRAGSTNRDSGGVVIPIDYYWVHYNYNPSSSDYDFAILHLSRSLSFSNSIQSIALPSEYEGLPDGTPVLISGWGTTSTGGSTSQTLLATYVYTVNQGTCNNNYYGQITSRMFCAAAPGKDSCQG